MCYGNLKWSDPMPTQEEMDEHYGKYYLVRNTTVDKNKIKKNIKEIISFRKLRKLFLLKEIERHTSKGLMVDFGCGNDDLLVLSKERGWEVIGVDYTDEEKDFYEKNKIKFIKAKTLEETGLESESIGCLVLKHTIEHIIDITGFISTAKKYLKAKGLLAIKTPSASSIRAKLNLTKWHYVNPPEHQWGFDKYNFKLLMENNGFDILYLKDSFIVNELICVAIKK